MDSRNYSSFTDLVWGNINLEDELFDVSESSPLIVEDSPMNDEVATSKKKPARGVNFNAEEDKLLVATWLNTSVDPVYGNEQYKTTFYGKVAKYFTDHKTNSTRSVASLTTRWGTINKEIAKFVGSLAKIEAKNESGTTAHDKDFSKWASTVPKEDSRKEMPQTPDSIDQRGGLDGIMDFERPISRKAEKGSWEEIWRENRHGGCWFTLIALSLILDFPKWASTMPKEDSRKEMPQTPDSIDQRGGLDGIMDFERLIGRKAEKANQKRKDDGKDIATEYLKKKMKILEEGYAAEKEKVRIKAEKVRLQELKKNERIMMLDISGMNEDQRTFYDELKKEILAKQRSSHSLG
ncbi:uncharacterized protein LOC111994630 [Quercus suber]|uniref:uncharacterized protein LOC111994630 n=1 Tax=Quercus suber TaxID=58331 RepID=UPI0032DFEC2A